MAGVIGSIVGSMILDQILTPKPDEEKLAYKLHEKYFGKLKGRGLFGGRQWPRRHKVT